MDQSPNSPKGGSPFKTVTPMVRVWDPVVRLFHWTVAISCVLNLFVLEEGEYWHRMTGYTVAIALCIRIVWGFAGTHYARFSQFFPTRAKIAAQLRDISQGTERRMLGHTPLASIMMLTLMALLIGTCLTGWMTTLDAFFGDKWLKQLHGLIANIIMILAFAHAGAALVESWRHKENLVWAMMTGRKRR